MSQWKNEVEGIAREMSRAPQIQPEEIPDLEIYMDQLTTYLDKRLSFYSREAEAPFITRSMVNNYSKARLLPPPDMGYSQGTPNRITPSPLLSAAEAALRSPFLRLSKNGSGWLGSTGSP